MKKLFSYILVFTFSFATQASTNCSVQTIDTEFQISLFNEGFEVVLENAEIQVTLVSDRGEDLVRGSCRNGLYHHEKYRYHPNTTAVGKVGNITVFSITNSSTPFTTCEYLRVKRGLQSTKTKTIKETVKALKKLCKKIRG